MIRIVARVLVGLCAFSVLSLEAAPELRAPPGFIIEPYAEDLPGARSLTLGKQGTVFVGTRREGKVYALRDTNGDHRVDKRIVIASGLNMPNGVSYLDGNLYVAEMHRILRFDAIEEHLSKPPQPVVIYDHLPSEQHHGWRYLAAGPDGRLYVAIGAPCNVCLRPGFAQIISLRIDGSDLRIEAQGVRNSVGFDWHPATGALWFTDNGRDWLGDDSPPDELNRVSKPQEHFGFPFCHGTSVADPEFGEEKACASFTPPVVELGAHVAALGMRFYAHTLFPAAYRHNLFIAEHGSWNRSSRVGYRISRVVLKADQAPRYEAFIEGWLTAGQVTGRPVDILQLPDGSLLVSDDYAGVIFRISYHDVQP